MLMLASLRSDRWTASPELVDDFIGIRSGTEETLILAQIDVQNRDDFTFIYIGDMAGKKPLNKKYVLTNARRRASVLLDQGSSTIPLHSVP
jgi:hypothetical protein